MLVSAWQEIHQAFGPSRESSLDSQTHFFGDELIMFTVHTDKDGDIVVVLFWCMHLTFYKAYKNRLPIVTWFRDCE